MSAQALFDNAPLGALVRYSDGAPRPPKRHVRRMQEWRRRNGQGRLIEKSQAWSQGSSVFPASFAIHEGDYGAGGLVMLSVRRIYDVRSALRFEVVETVPPGRVLCLTRSETKVELHHVAADMAQAQRWASTNPYAGLTLELVGVEVEAQDRSV